VVCQQIVNTNVVINTPVDYTAQEPVAQGKKLQNEKDQQNQAREGNKETDTSQTIGLRTSCIYNQK